jgi:hypothetical protein
LRSGQSIELNFESVDWQSQLDGLVRHLSGALRKEETAAPQVQVVRRTRWALAASAGGALVAILAVLWQWQFATRELAERRLELDKAKANLAAGLSRTQLARGYIDGALRLALLGMRTEPADAAKASPAIAALVAAISQIAVLRGHDGPVNSAAFSPDGSRVVTASANTTARIWDVPHLGCQDC